MVALADDLTTSVPLERLLCFVTCPPTDVGS